MAHEYVENTKTENNNERDRKKKTLKKRAITSPYSLRIVLQPKSKREELRKIVQSVRDGAIQLQPLLANLSADDTQFLITEVKEIINVYGALGDMLLCQKH